MDKEGGAMELSEIEAGLQRLMPRGLGDSTRENLESMVDGLAGGAVVVPVWKRPAVWRSAAAALLVAGLVGAIASKQGPATTLASVYAPVIALSAEQDSGISILEQKTWIEGGADLGVQAINDEGDVSQGWGYVGVEEERVLHEHSGYEVILQRGFEAEMYGASSL